MKCQICGEEMVISEWDGWRWVCFFCDQEDRIATDIEIEEYEEAGSLIEFNKNRQNKKKLRRLL